jgi:hypothetical protein
MADRKKEKITGDGSIWLCQLCQDYVKSKDALTPHLDEAHGSAALGLSTFTMIRGPLRTLKTKQPRPAQDDTLL